jgi:hypothetical protein
LRLADHRAKHSEDTFDLPSAFRVIEQSNRDVLTGLVYSWTLAVHLLQLREDNYRECAPTAAEARLHEHFLGNLITVAEFIAPRIRVLAHHEQARFAVEQSRLTDLKQRRFTAASTLGKLNQYISRAQKANRGI